MSEKDEIQRRAEKAERELVAMEGLLAGLRGDLDLEKERNERGNAIFEEIKTQSLLDRDQSIKDVAWAEGVQAEAMLPDFNP